MTGAIAPLDDLNQWARGDLLEIVLLVLGAILLTRLAEWVRDRIVAHIDAQARETDELVRSEAAEKSISNSPSLQAMASKTAASPSVLPRRASLHWPPAK